MIRYLSHLGIKLSCYGSDRRFRRQSGQLEMVQRKKLDQILSRVILENGSSVKNYEELRTLPLIRYKQVKTRIEQSREGKQRLSRSPIVRYQPTSGSSESIKFIPYTKGFLSELDSAIGPWLMGMYRQFKGMDRGKHYWSVSWLPESQRAVLEGENLNDDSALLGLTKRILSKYTQTVPSEVAFASDADDALFATLCYLVADESLGMISVWSPTFALQLFEQLNDHADEINRALTSGSWGDRASNLELLTPPHAPERADLLCELSRAAHAESGQIDLTQLWPKLTLVSSWDTAGAKPWAKILKDMVPHSGFEGKGLWATEGVVTIPYDGHYPLAYQSHFYEFERLSDGEILPSWELKLGDDVSPIISSDNGLLRYCMDDHIRVVSFMGEVPCFEFQGRRFGVDLVGEKLDPSVAVKVMGELSSSEIKPISLLAVDTQGKAKPYYIALFEGEQQLAPQAEELDQLLKAHFHYELARDLGQLAEPQVLMAADGWKAYRSLAVRDGMIEGNIKPEPLKKIAMEALNAPAV